MTALRAVPDASILLGEAVAAYLRTLDHPESRGTRKQYGSILGRLSAALEGRDVAEVSGADLDDWMKLSFAHRAPKTWNLARSALGSAWLFFGETGMADPGVPSVIRRRSVPENRNRAIPRDVLEDMLSKRSLPIRERTLWTMLYETAARVSEVLRLDAEELDYQRRRVQVTRKGGARDWVTWSSGTAFLLPKLLKSRRAGPLFVTTMQARAGRPVRDMTRSGHGRLSVRQAEDIFREATAGFPGGPWPLHSLRHRQLTDLGEQGASTPMLKAKSGHRSGKSVEIYCLPGVDALAAWEADHDPSRRR